MEILEGALRLPATERISYLQKTCGGDTRLLSEVSDALSWELRMGSFLKEPVAQGVLAAPNPEEELGKEIGPYRLMRVLGEGGMGVVYEASQFHPIRRNVALKLVKPGMDSRQVISRFETERQSLAMMDHPNIAKVFDAGATTTGRPYFVMGLVKGVPITRFCDERKLSVQQRLELFVSICQGIQHAHQKGIIHRDIKPSNLLVEEVDGQPVPRVIDFGIAKATGPQVDGRTVYTHAGMVVGTLEYMSPEQASGFNDDVDTRTDVYALGVVLYELLTGTTPLIIERRKHADFAGILQAIRDEEPPAPSTRLRRSTDTLRAVAAERRSTSVQLVKTVRGDLDWIVMKTLEKDRRRRYESVNGLARDLQRHMAGQPVEAGPASRTYRVRKFVGRHRLGVGAAGLVALSLVGGLAVSIRASNIAIAERGHAQEQARQAQRERARAEQQAELARQRQAQAEAMRAVAQTRSDDVRGIANELLSGLQETVSTLPGGTAAREQLVSRALEYLKRLEKDSANDPVVQAEIALGYRRLGDLYQFLYRPGQAGARERLKNYRSSIGLLKNLAPAHPEKVEWRVALAAAYEGEGEALLELGQAKPAGASLQRSFEVNPNPQTIRNLLLRSEALAVRANALAIRGVNTLNQTDDAQAVSRDLEEAVRTLKASAEVDPNRPSRWRILGNIEGIQARVWLLTGNAPAALRQVDHALETLQHEMSLAPGDFLAKRDEVTARGLRATILMDLGRKDDATRELQEALSAGLRLLEVDSENVLVRENVSDVATQLGDISLNVGNFSKSREYYEISARACEALLKSDPNKDIWLYSLASAYISLGNTYWDMNDAARAEEAYQKGLDVATRRARLSNFDSPSQRLVAIAMRQIGSARTKGNHLDAAIEIQEKALAIQDQLVKSEPKNAGAVIELSTTLGEIWDSYLKAGRTREAQASIERAVTEAERAYKIRAGSTRIQEIVSEAYSRLGQHWYRTGDPLKAVVALRHSVEMYAALTERRPDVVQYRRLQAHAVVVLGLAEGAVGGAPGLPPVEAADWRKRACATLAHVADMVATMKREGVPLNFDLLKNEAMAAALKPCPAVSK